MCAGSTSENAVAAQQVHLEAVQAWRAHPDGARFRHLAETLVNLVDYAVREAARAGCLTGRSPADGTPWTIRLRQDDEGFFLPDHRGLEVSDLTQEFLERTLQRYLDDPRFVVTGRPYVAMGLVLLARTELRRTARLGPLPAEGALEALVSDRAAAEDASVPEVVRAWWFHYPDCRCPVDVAAPGLSLRYLWVSIRVQSGTKPARVARELELDRSQLTRLKRELDDLFTGSSALEFLPLPPLRPVHLGLGASACLGVKEADPGLIRRPTARQLPGLLARKLVLWRVLAIASKDEPAPPMETLLDARERPVARLAWRAGKNLLLDEIDLLAQPGDPPALWSSEEISRDPTGHRSLEERRLPKERGKS